MFKKIAMTTTALMTMGSHAIAQDFYVGAAVGYSNAQCGGFCGRSSLNENGAERSLLAGVNWGITDKLFVGAEIETGKVSLSSVYPDTVRRGRVLAGIRASKFDVFISAGRVETSGGGFGIDGGGLSIGLGTNYHVNDKLAIRFELLKDSFETDAGYDWENQTTRVGAIFKF